ncbi:MAG: zinc ribbon domain-containing protein [Candidatus Bathyarchaeia archaeon]
MSQKRYCQYCGVEISPTTTQCPSCGAVQQAPAQSQQQPYVALQPQPPPPPVAANKSTGNILAAASIILGIVGIFVAGVILGIAAIIVGAAAISKKAKVGGAVGIILGFIAFVATLLLILGVITV